MDSFITSKLVAPPANNSPSYPIKRWVGDNLIFDIDDLLSNGKINDLKALVESQLEDFLTKFQTQVYNQYLKLMESLEEKTFGFGFSETAKIAIVFALRNAIFERIFYHLVQEIEVDLEDKHWVYKNYKKLQETKEYLKQKLIDNGDVAKGNYVGKLIYEGAKIIGVVTTIKRPAQSLQMDLFQIFLLLLLCHVIFQDYSFIHLPIVNVVISTLYFVGKRIFFPPIE